MLPSTLAHDKERLARFECEAKVLAQLSHPNIASVFGFDQDDDIWFLVMENVEGEDLSQRLKRGPIPMDEPSPLRLTGASPAFLPEISPDGGGI